MARLKLSPSGLRSPLEVPTTPAEQEPVATVRRAPRLATPAAPAVDPTPAPTAALAPDETIGLDVAPAVDAAPAPTDALTVDEAIDRDAGLAAPLRSTAAPARAEAPAADADVADAVRPSLSDASGPTGVTVAASDADVPAWAAALDPAALVPTRLLGRPKQTALILDRGLSTRADALVAATGPRVTFAAIVTAVLHFHLPADGEAAARTIGGYRRRRLDVLDHPWEERNARLPEPLRAELDDVVAGALGRVASVHRSTLVNALLDAHLPADADDASRLVTRMEMVRGGAFLDLVA